MLKYLENHAEYSYAVYSTHKHTKDNPRYRIVIPLSEPCPPDKYEAIARKVAEEINIELFDDTTYQPHRLMYYPSVSKDGEYVYIYKENEGARLDVNKWLRLYGNWKDRSKWKVSSREKDKVRKQKSRQQDPREKGGWIGALCNAYDVHEAIQEHLSDVYEPCGINRYTYTQGSSYGGVLVYDDGLFTYSNHATDPTCGKLCNVFDLIRIHKFGILDKDLDKEINTKYLPSFKAMIKWTILDGRIQEEELQKLVNESENYKKLWELVTQKNRWNLDYYKASPGHVRITNFYQNTEECRLEHAVTCIKKLIENRAEIHEELRWCSALIYNRKGIIMQNMQNVMLFLRNDKKLKDSLVYNEFRKLPWVLKPLPWVGGGDRAYKDADDSWMLYYLEKKYGMSGERMIKHAVNARREETKYHPITTYLNSLKWDGKPRAETLFIDYLGAEDNIYTRESTRKMLVSAVNRVYAPGCQVDTCVVLVGAQGIGKSQIIRRLGRGWSSDSLTTVKGKEAYEQIQGVWIMEIAELSAMKKGDVESIKHFISKPVDEFRGAYKANVEVHPRQCIFIGTTNTDDFLRDPTGNRRFLPIKTDKSRVTKNIWKELTDEEVGQIWAEAVELYKQGESLLLGDDASILAKEAQEEHTERNPYQELISNYLDMPVPEEWYNYSLFERINYINSDKKEGKLRQRICIIEVWQELLGGGRNDLYRAKSNEIKNAILLTGKWNWKNNTTANFGYLYGVQRYFERKISITL